MPFEISKYISLFLGDNFDTLKVNIDWEASGRKSARDVREKNIYLSISPQAKRVNTSTQGGYRVRARVNKCDVGKDEEKSRR